MNIMSEQYMRIEAKAGGIGCTNREFIKACHSVISRLGKERSHRVVRHKFINAELKKLELARSIF